MAGDAPAGALFEPGEKVDGFEIRRMLGRGGMGEVYLARDTRLGRKVALKVIHPQNVASPSALKRFFFEARATARFSHPNIVVVYQVGEFGGMPYLALEYLAGQNLRDRMGQRSEGFAPRQVIRLGLAVAEALKEAHSHRILHRDLKPENILLPRDGRVRVVDFGLASLLPRAKHADDEAKQLESDDRIFTQEWIEEVQGLRGSPPYMAPELWREQEPDMPSDIWSLGVVLFELLAGHRPYDEGSLVRLAGCIASAEPVSPVAGLCRGSQEIPAELPLVVDRCLAKAESERPSAAELVEIFEALLAQRSIHLSEEENPFRGLMAFSERHAPLFFGRDAEISAFVERMREQPVLPVVGPSGAGKSSFVLAGVVPRLREQGAWTVLEMRPGVNPFRALAGRIIEGEVQQNTLLVSRVSSLNTERWDPSLFDDVERQELLRKEEELAAKLRKSPSLLSLVLRHAASQWGTRVLLFVDQLEEVATLASDEEDRRCFMEAICTAADEARDPVRVVFTLREDFLSSLAGGAGVREALGQITVMQTPGPEALREILLKPLAAVKYSYEDARLVRDMLAEAKDEPAALPLLQFAAAMLWKQRDPQARVISRQAYKKIGGVAGALAAHAADVLGGLSDDEVRIARQLLMRLVNPDSTRKVVVRAELLEGLGDGASAVLDRLAGPTSRLVVPRKAFVKEGVKTGLELVHESLTTHWKQLARWIEESREDLVFIHDVALAADLWSRSGRSSDQLWQGEALLEALGSLRRCQAPVPQRVEAFLRAGQAHTANATRRKRVVVALVVLVLMMAAMVSYIQKEEAEAQRAEAEVQRAEAEAQKQLARLRWSQGEAEGARAASLAGRPLEARGKLRGSIQVADSTLARALWWELREAPLHWRRNLGATLPSTVIFPDGERVAFSSAKGAIYIHDIVTAEQLTVLRGHRDQVLDLVVSPDGRYLSSADWGGSWILWDLHKGTLAARTKLDSSIELAFSPDSSTVAAGTRSGGLHFWRVTDPKPRLAMPKQAHRINGVVYSPTGDRLAFVDSAGQAHLYDLASRRLTWSSSTRDKGLYSVAFSPDGRTVAAAGREMVIWLWNTKTGNKINMLRGHGDRINHLGFTPDGRHIASSGLDNTLRLWDVGTGREVARQTGTYYWSWRLDVGPRGKWLATSGRNWQGAIWSLPRLLQATRPGLRRHRPSALIGVAFTPDGKQVLAAGKGQVIHRFDVATGQVLASLSGHSGSIDDLKVFPDGKQLVTVSQDGTARIWDLASGVTRRTIRITGQGISAVAVRHDGRQIALGGDAGAIVLADPHSGRIVRRVVVPKIRTAADTIGTVYAIRYDKSGRRLNLCDGGGRVEVVDLVSGTWSSVGKSVQVHETYGTVFGAQEDVVFYSQSDSSLWRWRFRSTTVPEKIATFSARPYGFDIDRKQGRLVVPLSDGAVTLLSTDGRALARWTGHRGEANNAVFAPGGRLAASVSDDATVRLWDVASGRPLWRTVVTRPSPGCVYTHRGWTPIGDAKGSCGVTPDRDWARAVKARGALGRFSADSTLLCLSTGQELELWDAAQDRKLHAIAASGIKDLRSSARGCLVLDQQSAWTVARNGATRRLMPGAQAIGRHSKGSLVASDSAVRLFNGQGKELSSLKVSAGVTALAQVGEGVMVGYREGGLEWYSSAGERASIEFEMIPSSEVVSLVEGPRDTVLGGFANGTLAIWTARQGRRLHKVRLHGAVVHLHYREGKVLAASELGDHLVLDLSAFEKPWCDLVREVWAAVPVEWDKGRPVRRKPDPNHRCQPTP